MSPLSSLSKNLQHFLLVSLVWLLACAIYLQTSLGSLRLLTVTELLNILLGQCIIIGGIHYSELSRANREHLARLMENVGPTRAALFAYLTQIPDFLLDQWCVLPSPTGLQALAVDASRTRLVILNTRSHTDYSEESMTYKMWKKGDVASVSLEETDASHSWSMGQILNDHHTPYRISSKLLGTAGLPLAHPQISPRDAQDPSSPPLANPMPIESRPVTKLWLQLTFRAAEIPTEELIFLESATNTADHNYLFAREIAQHWHTILESFRMETTR